MTAWELKLNEDPTEGLYVAAFFSEESTAKIATWMQANGIPNPVSRSSLHTTIVYSRQPVPGFEENSHIEVEVDMSFSNLEVWDTAQGKTLVWHYFSPYLQTRFEEAMSMGATYDFEEYKSHITLSYDIGTFDMTGIRPPTFPITIEGEYAEVRYFP